MIKRDRHFTDKTSRWCNDHARLYEKVPVTFYPITFYPVTFHLKFINVIENFKLGILLAKDCKLGAFDGNVRGCQLRAERSHQYRVGFERAEHFSLGGGIALNATRFAFSIAQLPGSTSDVTRVELAGDTIQPCRNQAAQRQIRVVAAIAGFELQVDAGGFAAPGT